jgi:hypothetical protein
VGQRSAVHVVTAGYVLDPIRRLENLPRLLRRLDAAGLVLEEAVLLVGDLWCVDADDADRDPAVPERVAVVGPDRALVHEHRFLPTAGQQKEGRADEKGEADETGKTA